MSSELTISPAEPYTCPIPGVGNTVQAILDSTTGDSEPALYAFAQTHLDVFNHPCCRPLDVTQWVRELRLHPLVNHFTVRGLIKAMYDNAEILGLKRGKVYVSAAICACAVDALRNATTEEEPVAQQLAQAQSIARLASIWVAFFLWPYQRGLPYRMSKFATYISTLEEEVLKRDGNKCVVTGAYNYDSWSGPAGIPRAVLQVAHIFKRPLAVYETDKVRRSLATIKFEILKHYCELPEKYLNDNDFVDQAENTFTVMTHFDALFDMHIWCLLPTAIPNAYKFKNYGRANTPLYADPLSIVEFKDYSVEEEPLQPVGMSQTLGTRNRAQRGTDLPSCDLIRLHAALTGVLNMSGAASVLNLIASRHNPEDPPVPSADGESFWRVVMDSDIRDLRQSIQAMSLPSAP